MSALEGMPQVYNASRPLPWLVTSGQPSAEQLTAAADAGFRTVVDLRDPMEPRGFDEADLAARLGIAYYNIPVVGGVASDDEMDRIVAALRAHAGTPVLMHCASANRTGGPLIAWLMLEEGRTESQAVETAMRSGLRGADVMQWGVDYARGHGATG